MNKMIAFVWGLSMASALAADPFEVDFKQEVSVTTRVVRVSVAVPPGHHIFSDQVEASLSGVAEPLQPIDGDHPLKVHDAFSNVDRDSFTNSFTLRYSLPASSVKDAKFTFSYQGCSEKECFFPVTKVFLLPTDDPDRSVVTRLATGPAETPRFWEATGSSPRLAATTTGYVPAPDFLEFLDRAEGRSTHHANPPGIIAHIKAGFVLFGENPVKFLERYGIWLTVLLILAGGFLLNLTPCVLPMIPINLAILGIGSQNGTRSRGLLLGGAYGMGIALVYGVLGLIVVLTGAQFGTLNSLPWFNAAMGLLFLVLALAMFDLVSIDLTRFQPGLAVASPRDTGGVWPALIMGGVSALLAGACVAPVVIAVLLLAGSLFSKGTAVGLILPFILGLGMALPWPLAGAGLTLLPKPGAWMNRVKYGFGVFILLLALYYFSLAYHGWRGPSALPVASEGTIALSVSDHGRWKDILQESARDGRPILVDFWATWCKNCEVMELTTFRDKGVRERLSRYHVVKFQLENPSDPAAAAVADQFGVMGLPTYLVLVPVKTP